MSTYQHLPLPISLNIYIIQELVSVLFQLSRKFGFWRFPPKNIFNSQDNLHIRAWPSTYQPGWGNHDWVHCLGQERMTRKNDDVNFCLKIFTLTSRLVSSWPFQCRQKIYNTEFKSPFTRQSYFYPGKVPTIDCSNRNAHQEMWHDLCYSSLCHVVFAPMCRLQMLQKNHQLDLQAAYHLNLCQGDHFVKTS